jgi:superfamily II DNA or RNA helicase/ubiquinone/menaquinone biosynthesis C-methylase UbiE
MNEKTTLYKHLYQHQHDAIIEQNKYDKCLINMWCGTGKTRTFTIELFIGMKNINVIVFPSLGLINQYCNDYILSSNQPFQHEFANYACMAFCSKSDSENNPAKSLISSIRTIPSTTEEKVLIDFLHSTRNKIILVTYQSFEKFITTCMGEYEKNNIMIDTLIFDEAHHTVGDKIQNIVFNNDELDTIVKKTRFYTATPVNKNGVTMYDRDIPSASDCGPLAYEYLYYQAVEDGICKSFETHISLYTDEKPDYENKYQPIFETIIRACLSGSYDYWNILTYHAFVNENENLNDGISFVKEFASDKNKRLVKRLFKRIQNEEYPETKQLFSVDCVILKGIHSDTPARQKIINEFDKKIRGRIYILSSCGILNEGIDTKWANMGVPINPTNSIVKESQRLGRLLRTPEKDMFPSTVLIPCNISIRKYNSMESPERRDEMIREESSECGNFNTMLNVISAFKYQYDSDMFETCLKYPNMYSPDEVKTNLEKHDMVVDVSKSGLLIDAIKHVCESEDIEIHIDSFNSNEDDDELLNTIAIQCGKTIEIHTQDYDVPIKYINADVVDDEPLRLFYCADDKTYSPVMKKNREQKIGKKTILPCKKRPKLFDVHVHPDLKVLWKIKNIDSIDFTKPFCQGILDVDVDENEKRWMEKYSILKNMDNIPTNSYVTPCGIRLGRWCQGQRTMKRKNKLSKQCIQLLQSIKGWYWDVRDEKWMEYFLILKKMDNIPTNSYVTPCGIRLGGWCVTQRTMKRKNTLSKQRIQLLDSIKGWIWNLDEKRWMEKYSILQKMDVIPIQSYVTPCGILLGRWCQRQRTMKRKNTLSKQRIQLLESIKGWYWDVDDKKKKKSMLKPDIKKKKEMSDEENETHVKRGRVKSEISDLHQKYKTMNSENLNEYFQQHPEKWIEYHRISQENERSFPTHEIPRNKMIHFLEHLPGKKQKIVADLGCGSAEINQYFASDNSSSNRFIFHNFDHYSANELVVSRDIKNTGLDDYSVDIVILSLAMWGSNSEEYLKEAYRILDIGGTLLIAEAYKRWNKELDENDKPINRLTQLLETHGFTIIKNIEQKFMFIECRKN